MGFRERITYTASGVLLCLILLAAVAALFVALAACFLLVPPLFGGGLLGALIGVAAAVGVCGVAERIYAWSSI